MRYAHNDLHGLMIVDKPLHASSFGVVAHVRRAAGHCKTGHAGTLDPLATGVLIICFGKGTKAVESLMAATKVYETTIDLSALSETDDAEGPVHPVTPPPTPPTEAAIRAALDQLTGEITQVPPVYSAIKVGGKRAYDLARKGKEVEMPPRIVRIDRMEMLEYAWPVLRLRITCGKGTYIRSLARQIGGLLGTGGYLTQLRRTAVWPYRVEDAFTLENLPQPIRQSDLLPVPPTR